MWNARQVRKMLVANGFRSRRSAVTRVDGRRHRRPPQHQKVAASSSTAPGTPHIEKHATWTIALTVFGQVAYLSALRVPHWRELRFAKRRMSQPVFRFG